MNHTSKKLIALLAIAWVLGTGSLPAFDLRAFPTSADTDRIVEEGFEPSKKRLELALAQIPEPAKLKSLGGGLTSGAGPTCSRAMPRKKMPPSPNAIFFEKNPPAAFSSSHWTKSLLRRSRKSTERQPANLPPKLQQGPK